MIALLVAASVSMLLSLIGTPLLIRVQHRRGIGQPIREEGPRGHQTKAGTPIMGGIAIVCGATIGYVAAHVAHNSTYTWGGMATMAVIIGAGLVGLLDDGIKARNARNLGLNKRTKFAGLLVVGVAFTWFATQKVHVSTDLSFTRIGTTGIHLATAVWAIWAILLILGATNAVNLTDGLDGLAGASGAFSYSAYVVIAFWAFRHEEIYRIPQALDLAVVSAAMVGACAGFLWWNAAPAQIFMGDTGSLAIGAGLAAMALLTNTQLLLPILGGIYVVETLSVIVQVASFRMFQRRIFRMAPLHHHYELLGWPETTVIVRFWIVGAMVTAIGLGLFYADYLSIPGAR